MEEKINKVQGEGAIVHPSTISNSSNIQPEEIEVERRDVNDIEITLGADKILKVENDSPTAKLTKAFTPSERVTAVNGVVNVVRDTIGLLFTKYKKDLRERINSTEDTTLKLTLAKQLMEMEDDYSEGRVKFLLSQSNNISKIFKEALEECKKKADKKDLPEGHKLYEIRKRSKVLYAKIVDNFDALLEEAAPELERYEFVNIKIDSKNETTGGTVTENDTAKNQKDNDYGDNPDTKTDITYKVRTVDIYEDSLSKRIKRLFFDIPVIGKYGKLILDDLGYSAKMDPQVIHSILINEMANNVIRLEDFCKKDEEGYYKFPLFEKMKLKHPWVKYLITEMSSNPQTISMFYKGMRQEFNKAMLITNDSKPFNSNKTIEVKAILEHVESNINDSVVLDREATIYQGTRIMPGNSKEITSKLLKNTEKIFGRRGFGLKKNILSEEEYKEIVSYLTRLCRAIGINVKEKDLQKLADIDIENQNIANLAELEGHISNLIGFVEQLKDGDNILNKVRTQYERIARVLGPVLNLDHVQTYRQNGKMYNSYSPPCFLDTMAKSFNNVNSIGAARKHKTKIVEKYKQSEWYYNHKTKKWRNYLLELIDKEGFKLEFDDMISIKGVEYSDWTEPIIKEGFFTRYFSDHGKNTAFINLPVMADASTCKFMKINKLSEESIIPLLREVVHQEIYRMGLVADRKEKGIPPIGSFDKRGSKFCFFPELNNYVIPETKESFVTKIKDLTSQMEEGKILLNDYTEQVNEIIDNALKDIYGKKADKFVAESIGFLKDDLFRNDEEFKTHETEKEDIKFKEKQLREYYFNHIFYTSQIIQLTVGDLAFYKDSTDFQKRFKEIYAAGYKLNILSEYGKPKERVIYLSDRVLASYNLKDIENSLNIAVREGRLNKEEAEKLIKGYIEVNGTDAQAYRNLDSMRSLLDMAGEWTPSMAEAFDRLKSGKWVMEDLNIILQTVKPFLYTLTVKPTGRGDTDRKTNRVGGPEFEEDVMLVGHQNKNSEFALMSALITMCESPELKALDRFMSEYKIDVVNFESAVKAGKQGCIDISYHSGRVNEWVKKLNEEKGLELSGDFNEFKDKLASMLLKNEISQEEYNEIMENIRPTEKEVFEILEKATKFTPDGEGDFTFDPNVVHEFDYEDYIIQQPTPEHLLDTESIFGSQFRNLIISDLDLEAKFHIKSLNKELTGKEISDLYKALIVENLLESYDGVKDRFKDIHSLQKAILQTIKGNPKFGKDMVQALEIVKIQHPVTGKEVEVFNLPLDNLSTTDAFQEIVTSMFKNKVTKQFIKGGNAILTSNFGFSNDLKVKVKEEDGSIEYIECYLPAYSKVFFKHLMKKDSKGEYLDVNMLPEELRRIIGYRIPTEDKYSMAPLYIKGFLPQQNGSAIMLPAEITTIAGSNYEVDRLFLILPEFNVVDTYDYREAWKSFCENNPENHKNILWESFVDSYIYFLGKGEDVLNSLIVEDTYSKSQFEEVKCLKKEQILKSTLQEFEEWFKRNKEKYYQRTEIKYVKYDYSKGPQGNKRAARNNMILDISNAILTHPSTSDKILNFCSFDTIKKGDRLTQIMTNPALLKAYIKNKGFSYDSTSVIENLEKIEEYLSEESLESLNDFLEEFKEERNALTIDTYILNHKQNASGGKLISMYSINTTVFSKYQYAKFQIDPEVSFFINGREMLSLTNQKSAGKRISKNCAEFSAASVDNVKDPVLAGLMQNPNTAKVTCLMLRLGMTLEEITLMFALPLVREEIVTNGNLDNLHKNKLLQTKIKGGSILTPLPENFRITSKELLSIILKDTLQKDLGVTTDFQEQKQAVLLMCRLVSLANDMQYINSISRADSLKGAMKPSLAGAQLQVRKVDMANLKAKDPSFKIVVDPNSEDTKQIKKRLVNNDLLNSNMNKDTLREEILSTDTPMLQAFYSLGIQFGLDLVSKYFSQTSEFAKACVEEVCENSAMGSVSEKTIKDLHKAIIVYKLTETELLGDDDTNTLEDKRNYFIYKFPSEFQRIKRNYPEIAKLGIMSKLHVKDGKIIFTDSARLKEYRRAYYRRDIDMLLYMNEPKAQELALKLFLYSYYTENLSFGGDSINTFFSTEFLSKVTEYVDKLRNINLELQNDTNISRFMEQYYLNNINKLSFPQISYKNINVLKRGAIVDSFSVETAIVRNLNSKKEGAVFKYVTVGDYKYKLVSYSQMHCKYQRVTDIIDKGGFYYNAKISKTELVERSRIYQLSKHECFPEGRSNVVNGKFPTLPKDFLESIRTNFYPDISEENIEEYYRQIEEMNSVGPIGISNEELDEIIRLSRRLF